MGADKDPDAGRAAGASPPAAGGGEVPAEPAADAPPAAPAERVLLVNAADRDEVRIALLEDGRLEEIYVEAAQARSAAGSVYRGRVQNVEKGIGAAFVDLGKGQTGFLHVSDLPERPEGATVGELLEPEQVVLVQIAREGVGRKGPALTARVALPGRYLVLMTNTPRSGVSRRIGRGRGRERARRLLERLEVPEGMGLILRTAGEEAGLEDLRRDLSHLLGEWQSLREAFEQPGPPGLLRPESDLAERSVRDIMPAGTARIVVDRPVLRQRVEALLEAWYGPPPPSEGDGEEAGGPDEGPETAGRSAEPRPRVDLHEGPLPLFHAHGVERQLEEAYRRTLRLESGGSIVVDPTEALVAIDVNSGRSLAEEDPEATALTTNLEAVAEAARQLRLRDLGGLVVLDFIDMRDRRSIRKVEKALREALARDRARIRAGRIGPFGCLILSRQRIRQALSRVTHEDCPTCAGTGRRRPLRGLGLRVLREMEARAARSRGRGGLEVRLPPAVLDWVRRHRRGVLRDVEQAFDGPLRLVPDERLPADGWAMKGVAPASRAGGDAAPRRRSRKGPRRG